MPTAWKDAIIHLGLKEWLSEVIALCEPHDVYLCDGSQEEYDRLCSEMVLKGTLKALNADKRPNSFLACSTPDDVARLEEFTYICAETLEEAGPTNHWEQPDVMRKRLRELFKGSMRGRTLYIIPYSMGPVGSSFAQIGIECTDSPYVVCNMALMTHMGTAALQKLGSDGFFVKGLHSVGYPLNSGQSDVPWPCNATHKDIVHFPSTREIWSYGSGYGGNALLGKKCFALRIASVMARDEGWLAEHMLIMGLTSPEGKKHYIAASFPSSCGKTNLAMLTPTLPGWKVECVGDDIAWMRFGKDGRLYAMNPEAGFFGVAPGTSWKSSPNAMKAIDSHTLFTNVAETQDGDVWWEGMTDKAPPIKQNWLGHPWPNQEGERAAHPNARFTVSATRSPILDPHWQDPEGVPISAILFGGRRANLVPLVYESFNWNHGVFLGASVASETTAAAVGEIGKLRHDPFAMLPFCGYHMGDYFDHWVKMGLKSSPEKLPRIFAVNWFRKDEDGAFLWPGFGENIRVLEWVFQRCEGKGAAVETPIGYLPAPGSLNLNGLMLSPSQVEKLSTIDCAGWKAQFEELRRYFTLFDPRFPQDLSNQLEKLLKSL